MSVDTETTSPLVKPVIESREFKKAVQAIVDEALSTIHADNIDGLSDAVEEVINSGSFETSFSA